jgi:GNAT superfamily N-acetyltransferase
LFNLQEHAIILTMKVPTLLILPFIYLITDATDQVHSHVNLDLSKFYYYTKVIEDKSQLTITKLFKSPQHISHEITLQNILAFARVKNINRIEIPRSIINYPLTFLCRPILNITTITIHNDKWDYRLIAYPAPIAGVDALNIHEDSKYFDVINSHTNVSMYRIFAVDNDCAIIGGCQLIHDHLSKERSVIEHIYTSSGHRNKGIGSQLIEASKELTQAYAKSSIRLFAFAYGNRPMTNAELKVWYENRGFSVDQGKQWNLSASSNANQPSCQTVILEINYPEKKSPALRRALNYDTLQLFCCLNNLFKLWLDNAQIQIIEQTLKCHIL